MNRIILILFFLTGAVNAQTPITNTFTYQGELKLNNVLANGSYDFEFSVFDVPTAGTVLETVTVTNVSVTNGVFTTPITLSNDLFTGNKIWLDIAVKANGSTGAFDPLSPRQEVTSTPYAIHAQFVGANAVTGVQIQNGTITINDLHSNSVDSTILVDNSVTTSDIAASAITTTELADNSVTSAKILDGAIGRVDVDTTQIQQRVTMSCPNGQYLSGINQDGSVVCQILPVNSSALLDFVDNSIFLNGVIAYPSIAINQNNLPVISYYIGNTSASELRVVACLTSNCSSFNSFVKLDDVFFQGYTKVVIGNNNLPMIFYITSGVLKKVACTATDCSTFTAPLQLDSGVLGSNWGFGYEPLEVIIGSNGLPLITYIGSNGSTRALMVISCLQQDCGSFNMPLVLVANMPSGLHVDAILASNGLPLLAYYNGSKTFVITCNTLDCSTSNPPVQVPNPFTAGINSLDMTLGANGFPIIAMSSSSVVLLTCTAIDCSTATSNALTVDLGGFKIQLNVSSNNKPLITHYNTTTKDLKMVHCFDVTCDNPSSIIAIDNNKAFAETTSAMNQNKTTIFAYYYNPNSSNRFSYLKVFSCGNESCQN